MLYLVFILLLTFFALTAILWSLTRLIQTALYEQPQADLYWRAPAAAGALTVYLGIWALINYAAADPRQTDLPFGSLFDFTTEKVSEPVSEFTAVRSGGRMKYKFIPRAGSPGVDYRSDDAERKVWMGEREADVQALLVKQGDREVKFTPDTAHQRYVEEGGKRYLEQDQRSFGRIIGPRGGGFFVRFLLNVLHLAAWFVALWLLLGFQWSHALGMAIAIWLAMTYVAPYILRAGAEAKAPPAKVVQWRTNLV